MRSKAEWAKIKPDSGNPLLNLPKVKKPPPKRFARTELAER